MKSSSRSSSPSDLSPLRTPSASSVDTPSSTGCTSARGGWNTHSLCQVLPLRRTDTADSHPDAPGSAICGEDTATARERGATGPATKAAAGERSSAKSAADCMRIL
eukprot:77886-Prymnesium_polylepis.1